MKVKKSNEKLLLNGCSEQKLVHLRDGNSKDGSLKVKCGNTVFGVTEEEKAVEGIRETDTVILRKSCGKYISKL